MIPSSGPIIVRLRCYEGLIDAVLYGAFSAVFLFFQGLRVRVLNGDQLRYLVLQCLRERLRRYRVHFLVAITDA